MVNNRIELQYKAKEDLKRVIATTPPATLKKIKSFGQNRLDGGCNMLIFGDNLQVLKTLIGDPNIKEKVRLVYIDPPFGTNQDFKSGISRTVY